MHISKDVPETIEVNDHDPTICGESCPSCFEMYEVETSLDITGQRQACRAGLDVLVEASGLVMTEQEKHLETMTLWATLQGQYLASRI